MRHYSLLYALLHSSSWKVADVEIRAGLWMLDKILEVVAKALNAFPLFEVLLRFKEPSRLPCTSFYIHSLIWA